MRCDVRLFIFFLKKNVEGRTSLGGFFFFFSDRGRLVLVCLSSLSFDGIGRCVCVVLVKCRRRRGGKIAIVRL